jgi:hypothetical protein
MRPSNLAIVGLACFCMLTTTVRGEGPKHVIFAFVDHFEPECGTAGDTQLSLWTHDYSTMAQCHTDSYGHPPVHTYFYKVPRIECELSRADGDLVLLNQITYAGCGEIEVHLHHGVADERTRTAQQATQEFLNYLDNRVKVYYPRHGAIVTCQATPRIAFGYIAGNWALDNARYDTWTNPNDPHYAWSGVNQELSLLKSRGCFADYTHPSWGPMDPYLKDSIFYARDDEAPASYQNPNNVAQVYVTGHPFGDLMIIEGPGLSQGGTTCNIGYVEGTYDDPPTLMRMDQWVSRNVHVVGRSEWVFVKVYTHGVTGIATDLTSRDYFFGPTAHAFYDAILAAYGDGTHWLLHYASAREMYNMIKAAEAGMSGDPELYRDFAVPPPANTRILTGNMYQLISYTPQGVLLRILEQGKPVDLSFKEFLPSSLVMECSDPNGAWVATDAQVISGAVGELRLVDATPSAYYQVWSGSSGPPTVSVSLTVSKDTDGSVQVDPAPGDLHSFTVAYGSTVTFTAIANDKRRFKAWQLFDPLHPGDANYMVVNTANPLVITAYTDLEVVATFGCGITGTVTPVAAAAVLACWMVGRSRRPRA